ncbi:hypothetical protein N657DRAFT_644614 [Parathielavia appendiculata]|uniref:Uncharacterized protein n=1 Tax=Parathielavia appendiculata TaxID=2587402 RepID=A0AAN6U1T1_9PEZI|nr:hypothetical protein N657DRAFT_644614 [Parathielavia appendiculata]
MATLAELLSTLTGSSTAPLDAINAAVEVFNSQARAAGPDENSVGDYVWEAMNALFAAAGRTPPDNQGPLVEFVVRLESTTATDAEGKALNSSQGQVWKDLPYFGIVARESLNYDVHDPKATKSQRAEWENEAAFMARLSAQSSPGLDLSLYGLWMLRAAFEEEDGAPTELSRTAVRIAAMWICFAGEQLRKKSAHGETLAHNLGVSRGKYREREWRGFNEDRWQVWKDGLKAVQENFGSDEVIKAAVEVMERL